MKFLETIFKKQGTIAISEKINGFHTTFYNNHDDIVLGDKHDTYIGCCTYREGIAKGRGKRKT